MKTWKIEGKKRKIKEQFRRSNLYNKSSRRKEQRKQKKQLFLISRKFPIMKEGRTINDKECKQRYIMKLQDIRDK